MSREPLHLDVRSMPKGLDNAGVNAQPQRSPLRMPEPADVARFAQSMQAPTEPASDLPPGPFALFGKHPVQAQASVPSDPADPAREVLQSLVKQLLVSDGREGRRSARIGLTDEAMPGVEVEVFQASGAWVASFECRDPSSFERLAQPAEQMAQELSRALESDAIWRVKPLENAAELAHLSLVEARAFWDRVGGAA